MMVSNERLKDIAKDEHWRICMMDIPPIVRELLAARDTIDELHQQKINPPVFCSYCGKLICRSEDFSVSVPAHMEVCEKSAVRVIAAENMQLRETISRLSSPVTYDDWANACKIIRASKTNMFTLCAEIASAVIEARLNPSQPEAK